MDEITVEFFCLYDRNLLHLLCWCMTFSLTMFTMHAIVYSYKVIRFIVEKYEHDAKFKAKDNFTALLSILLQSLLYTSSFVRCTM